MARLKPGTPWTGWDDAREPLVNFEFTRGWTAECPDDSTVEFARASDRATEGRYAGRVASRATNAVTRVVLRPPSPIPIPEPFDSVEIRLSVGVEGEPTLAGERPSVRVALAETDGALRVVDLGSFPRRGWHLAHRRLPVESPLDGARLLGIEISDWKNPAKLPLYLAGLTFYTESRTPIVPAWRAPPLDFAPLAAQAARAEGPPPLAEPPAPGARVELDADAEIAEFSVPLTEGRLVYRLRLGPGLGPVEVFRNDDLLGAFSPPIWTPETATMPDRVIAARRAGESAIAIEFQSGRRARVALMGRALAADLASDRRDIAFVEASAWSPAIRTGGRLDLAFLNAGGWIGPEARWICPRAASEGLAVCAYLDPYVSRASRWEMGARGEEGVRPIALYDEPALGRRCAIRERLVWAVGERVEEVLPPIPSERRPAPAGSSPPMFEATVDDDELHPLDSAWSRYVLRRDAAGQWVAGATEGAYRVKWPLLAGLRRPALEEGLAERQGSPVALIAGRTAGPPWAGTDYDPRAPAAGQFAAARRGMTEWYRAAAREFDAPVIGFADWIWFWADALDFWRAQSRFAEALMENPLRPEFSLCRLRVAGEGLLPPPVLNGAAAWDRWAAAALWYGMGLDWPERAPDAPEAERARRMTDEIARRTRGRAPVSIAYHDGRSLVGGLAAAATGADASLARLYLRYDPDLEVWINRGEAKIWKVAVGREDWVLPKDGWVARGEGLFVFSGLADGGRVDYLEQGNGIHFDPRGAWRAVRDVAADGPAYFLRDRTPEGWRWEIEALGELRAIAVRSPRAGGTAEARAVAWAGESAAPGEATAVNASDWLRVTWPAGARRVRIEWRASEHHSDRP